MNRAIALLLMAMCANAPAYELTLTAPEKAKCDSDGGCDIVTRAQLRAALQLAYDAGRKTCEVRL